MSEKTKRPWFRFHLLTAVLMMVAAGAFMLPNVQERRFIPEWADNEPAREFGWPATAVTFYSAYAMMTPEDVVELQYRGLIIDGATVLAIVLAVAFVSESLIRRREACRQ